MKRLFVVACILTGCHPYLSAGMDTTTKVSGPLQGMMSQPVVSARQFAALPAPAPAAPQATHTYSAAMGWGTKDFGAEVGVHVHDVSSDSFTLPSSAMPDSYLASPRYLTSTGSVDFRWTYLRSHGVSTYIHVGPAVGAVVDKSSGSTALGQGVRYGAGLAVEIPVVRVFLDASRTDLDIGSGDATGFNSLSGVTLGVALH
jgi:hypothetical protein